MLKSENIPILIGFLVWLGCSLISLPASTFSLSYVQILILAAPLWLIPLTWQLLDTPEWIGYLGVPASITLAIAFLVLLLLNINNSHSHYPYFTASPLFI